MGTIYVRESTPGLGDAVIDTETDLFTSELRNYWNWKV